LFLVAAARTHRWFSISALMRSSAAPAVPSWLSDDAGARCGLKRNLSARARFRGIDRGEYLNWASTRGDFVDAPARSTKASVRASRYVLAPNLDDPTYFPL
jgi:pyocin large subunit-like protein